MRAHSSVLFVLCFLLPACAAQTPALEGSALAAMQRDSVGSVDISLGPVALGFLSSLSGSRDEHDPQSAAAMNLFHELHKVRVRSFQFATDHAYGQADLEALRSQLTGAGWHHVVQARDRGSSGDVDIYCVISHHMITRVVIIAAEPREFTLVNIVGTIDPDQIGMLRGGFTRTKSIDLNP